MGRGLPAGRRRWMALGALSALLMAGAVQGRIEARSAAGTATSPMLYLPSGKYLRVVALGFDEIVADIIYLWSIQYYGNYRIEDRYAYLDHIYGQVITELDPRYLDPYLVGSLIMNLEARDPEAALRLLDKGIERNPQRWILAFEAGFLCYNDLRDYGRAATYFEKALRADDVHPLVRRLYAEMYNRAGDRRTSLREWREIYETAGDEYVRNTAWNHVHDLTVAVHLADLREAAAAFRERRGRWPRRLEEIVGEGLMAALPPDPEGRGYLYDPGTGRIEYRGSLVMAH